MDMSVLVDLVNKKTPEERRSSKIEAKAKSLYYNLTDNHDLTVDEQVEALIKFTTMFKEDKHDELDKIKSRQKELEQALEKLG